MTLDIDQRWAFAVLLLACRIGAALLMTPVLGQGVPVQVRVFLVFALGLALAAFSGARYTGPLELSAVALGMLNEAALGAVLAFGIASAFAAFSFAGKVLDVQSGFALANLFDPLSHTASPVLATALNMLAVVVFFALDGHHALMRGFAFSVEQVPLGSTFVVRPEAAVRQFGAMFSLGLALIAPAFVCLFIVELATSVMSRVLPQANVLVVVIPAKIFVGLAMLALSLPMLAPAMGRIYATIFRFWEEVLRHG